MEILEVGGVRLAGVAACIPRGSVPNDPKVAAATGIPARRVASEGVTGLDLCVSAARRLFGETGAHPEEFGAILSVSFTQQRMPANAAQAQAQLGLPTGVLAFDILQACAGYGYGLYLAALLVRQTGKKVLLLDGDRQSAFLDTDDPATSPLLSDGGTATIVEPGESTWRFAFSTDGAKGAALCLAQDGAIRMDGFGVFRFVATDVVAFLREFRTVVAARAEATIDVFAPHQPNVYLVRQLAKSIGLDDRVLVSADRFGNLSSASVPATLVAQFEGKVRANPIRALLSGFGGGLSISAASLDIPPACLFALEMV